MASLQLSPRLGAVLTDPHHHSECVSTGAVDPSSSQPTLFTRLPLEAAHGCSGQGVVTAHSRATSSAVLPVTNDNVLPTPPVETWIQQLHGRVGPFSLWPTPSSAHTGLPPAMLCFSAQTFALIKGLALRAGQTPKALSRRTPGILPASVPLILEAPCLQLLSRMMRGLASSWCPGQHGGWG